MANEPVGEIIHYYAKIGVGIVRLTQDLKKGDKIAIEGKNKFEQTIDSMQIEHDNVEEAKKGDSIGLKVVDRVREGDQVFKV